MEILQYARLDGPERRAQHFVYRVGRCWPRPARSGLRSARYTYSSGRFAEPPETPATMEGGVRRGKRERGAASPVVRLLVGEAAGQVPTPMFRRSKNTSWNHPGARPPASGTRSNLRFKRSAISAGCLEAVSSPSLFEYSRAASSH